MKVQLIFILFFILSCRNAKNVESKQKSRDTLHFQNELQNVDDNLPNKGEEKIISINKIDSFFLNRKYSVAFLQNIELITNQEEFEKIASRNNPTNNEMPIVDFSKNYMVAIILDNKIAKPSGYEPIDISFRLDTCKRSYDEILINFSLIQSLEQSQRYSAKQLYLYQIRLDKNLKRVNVMSSNGMFGRVLEFSKIK